MSTGTDLPAATQGKPATAARGAFERLHAFDGLFLRAEHLEVMQDYARDLAMATGRAGGSGVVQGYGLTVDESTTGTAVVAEPGLAIAPDGRPLLATEPLTVTLEGRDPGDSTYYRVLLQPGTWHHGDEPVQGLLCDEPCSDGTTRNVLTAEGPWLSLEAVSDDRFGAHRSGRRSWLAR
ncbi:hypothetical protein PU560_10595, partial [Georgenia sp. 10Sc9-8]|nr:hypothetical protein [Georgenia halotolerans]